MQTQRRSFNQTQAVNTDSLKVDLVVKKNSCSEKEDSNSETASSKSAKECSLNSETQDVHAIKYKMTDSIVQDDNSRLGNDTDADDADINPIYDEEPMDESSADTILDASNKRHQQPDSTSFTSTLATTVTANGNFDLYEHVGKEHKLIRKSNQDDHVKEMMQDDLKELKVKRFKGSRSKITMQ
ncbi:hypothetical protein Tco_1503395 [Tanacetum coccineum]